MWCPSIPAGYVLEAESLRKLVCSIESTFSLDSWLDYKSYVLFLACTHLYNDCYFRIGKMKILKGSKIHHSLCILFLNTSRVGSFSHLCGSINESKINVNLKSYPDFRKKRTQYIIPIDITVCKYFHIILWTKKVLTETC